MSCTKLYKAVIEVDRQNNPRTRLQWKSDFSTKLRELYPDVHEVFRSSANLQQQYPDMIFLKRKKLNTIMVAFVLFVISILKECMESLVRISSRYIILSRCTSLKGKR